MINNPNITKKNCNKYFINKYKTCKLTKHRKPQCREVDNVPEYISNLENSVGIVEKKIYNFLINYKKDLNYIEVEKLYLTFDLLRNLGQPTYCIIIYVIFGIVNLLITDSLNKDHLNEFLILILI